MLIFLSCSNTVPRVISQKVVLVFDFSLEGKKQQRLSVFTETSAEIGRIKEILVEYRKEKLLWKLTTPDFIAIEQGTWTGSAQLVMQEPHTFPTGEYMLTVSDYNGKSATSQFTLNYPTSILTANAAAITKAGSYPELTQQYFIVYDKNKTILSISNESPVTDQKQIKAKYPAAGFTQVYRESVRDSWAVLLPPNAIAH